MGDIKGKRVLTLVDFNVPNKDGAVKDDFRIRKTLPTINFLRGKGAKIFLLSHIGSDKDESLRFIARYCERYFPVTFAESVEEAKSIDLNEKEVILLENVRLLSKGEVANDPKFSARLASLGDCYVNEAFSLSHRPHSSVIGVPKLLPSYAGFLFSEEVATLAKAFNPSHPFVLVLGGKKAETKIPLIERFISSADKIFVGGALANDFLRAKGFSVGKSVVSKSALIKKEWLDNPKLVLPRDVVVDDGAAEKEVAANAAEGTARIVDAGKSFIEELKSVLGGARLAIWNGTLGICEEGFNLGTDSAAEAIVSSGAFTIAGGGDTVSEIDKISLADRFSFVSTGGGAMLEFLADGTLPGIAVLEAR